jgi:hypothetical protein
MCLRNLSLLLLLIIPVPDALPQRQPDMGMWNTFSMEKAITKNYSISIDEEVRLRDNITRLNLLYTNVCFNYKPAKGLKIGLAYRSIQKHIEGLDFSFRHRIMLDISYKYKINDIVLAYRSRFQSEVKNYYSSEMGQIPEWFWRNKFDVKYNFKKLDPYIGTELRYQFTDSRNPYLNYGWHRYRTYIGVDYNINDKNSIGIYYLIQREFNVSNPEYIYILGLQYSVVL